MENRTAPVSLSPGTEKVRIAKSQVSPNRNITPVMLIIKRMTVSFLMGLISCAAFRLLCRISTEVIHMNIPTLKIMTVRIGARKAPQNAPVLDRKQLCKFQSHIIIIIIYYYYYSGTSKLRTLWEQYKFSCFVLYKQVVLFSEVLNVLELERE